MIEASSPALESVRALADPTRRDLVARLAVGGATVAELTAPYDISVQAASKHLTVLADAGHVSQRKDASAGRAISRPRWSTWRPVSTRATPSATRPSPSSDGQPGRRAPVGLGTSTRSSAGRRAPR